MHQPNCTSVATLPIAQSHSPNFQAWLIDPPDRPGLPPNESEDCEVEPPEGQGAPSIAPLSFAMGGNVKIFLAALVFLLSATATQAQWEIEESHTTASLRGIHNVGAGIAWASGTNGTVLRTEDGGYMWQTCAMPPGAEKLDFRGIQAFDENTAIVMSSGPGDQSRLYKTTDGCQTWKLIFTNPDKDGFWDSVFFTSRENGWLLGDPTHKSFTLFATNDSGKTWIRQRNRGLLAQPKLQGAFAASNSSLLVKDSYVLFGTGGMAGAFVYWEKEIVICLDCEASALDLSGRKSTWVRQPLAIGQKAEAAGVFSIDAGEKNALLGTYAVVAVGGDYNRPDISEATCMYSPDNGDSWFPTQTPPHGYRSAVAYDATTKTWITVGPNGTDISTDDGRNWRALTPTPQDAPDADKNWNALSLPFVVGPKGRIGKLRTTALPAPDHSK